MADSKDNNSDRKELFRLTERCKAAG
jgi:hypothetical protein